MKKSSKKISRKRSKKSKKGGSEEKKKVRRPQKEIDDVIKTYLDDLDEKLKGLSLFWVFPDEKGFKKLKIHSIESMQEYLAKDVDKYKNRKVAEISINTYHKDKDSFYKKNGIWLTARIILFQIDPNGIIKKNTKQFDIRWEEDDFRLSKISFKLLERCVQILVENKYSCASLHGLTLRFINEQLKKKNIDISDTFSPLKNLKKYILK